MKKIIIGLVFMSSVSAYAVDLSNCNSQVRSEVTTTLEHISDLDELDKYSDEMLDILQHSVFGVIHTAPSCESIKGLTKYYKKAFQDLK